MNLEVNSVLGPRADFENDGIAALPSGAETARIGHLALPSRPQFRINLLELKDLWMCRMINSVAKKP